MNIAYLILAHHQPLQLKRLVASLDQPNVRFYIHIDKKSKDIAAFRHHLSGYEHVTIISTRDVNWMGYTTIEAQLDLVNLAFNSGIAFKYFVLMSGQDYPIKSNEYINDFYSKHSSDFISYTNLNFISDDMRNKITRYHFRDIPFINPRSPKKIPLLVYLYFGTHKRIAPLLPKRKFYKDLVPYFGSQWFALTHDTIACILNFVKDNDGYVRSMKHTDGPDEMFFQTIILNSERKQNVCDYDKYLEWLKDNNGEGQFRASYTSLRYMDWSERGKSKPAVLDMEYYDTLATTEELYGRKFDEHVSAELMDKIDSTFLQNNR